MPFSDSVTHVRGDSFKRTYVLSIIGGGVVDMTPWTIAAQVRTTAEASEVLAEMTVEVTQPPESGVITLSLTAAQTAGLPVGTVVYDIELTDSVTGEVWTPIQGTLKIVPDVTRV